VSPGRPKAEGPISRLRALLARGPLRALGLMTALLIGIGIVGLGAAVEMTSRPRFCGSCHIMRPYYESWKHSSHRNIACVECHIAPGVTAEIRKKWEALSMVTRYFTGTYGTNPWTEIEDAACLRCHERRLLMGKETIGDVLFDHSNHLSEMRRGKTLRCTSCHSQIVQGSHIAVTTSTCILCHFKGEAPGQGTARCTLCHRVPETTYRVDGFTFEHADVARFGMECTWCHSRPPDSDGSVPRERCITCHNQAARLEKYGDTELLHRKHVTEHKVDCMDCHLTIEHVAPLTAETAGQRLALAQSRIHRAASDCRGCHEAGHSPQLDLYAGTGGRGVPPMPSPMFEAGVRCEGCHMPLPGQDAAVNRASEISCMACHGPSYRKIYRSWKEGSERRVASVARELQETERALAGPAPRSLIDARHNVDIVRRGHGVHNISYAYALLVQAHEGINTARRARGLAPLPRPWREPRYSSPCLVCHAGIEDQRGEIYGKRFAHEGHVIAAGIECVTCHRPHEEKPEGEVVRFDSSGCIGCHHKEPVRDCASCHTGIRQGTVKSFRGDFDHALHIDDAGKTCTDCHDVSASPPRVKQEACKECHED
jgi:nitrate/TMAO reductase-like tetraheme cytochrome c subunit